MINRAIERRNYGECSNWLLDVTEWSSEKRRQECRMILLKVKGMVYKIVTRPAITRGLNKTTLNKKMETKMKIAEIRMLKRMNEVIRFSGNKN